MDINDRISLAEHCPLIGRQCWFLLYWTNLYKDGGSDWESCWLFLPLDSVWLLKIDLEDLLLLWYDCLLADDFSWFSWASLLYNRMPERPLVDWEVWSYCICLCSAVEVLCHITSSFIKLHYILLLFLLLQHLLLNCTSLNWLTSSCLNMGCRLCLVYETAWYWWLYACSRCWIALLMPMINRTDGSVDRSIWIIFYPAFGQCSEDKGTLVPDPVLQCCWELCVFPGCFIDTCLFETWDFLPLRNWEVGFSCNEFNLLAVFNYSGY